MFPFDREEEWSSFVYMTYAKSHASKRKNQDSDPEVPPGEPVAMRQLFVDTPGGPDGCASAVFLYLSSHSGLSMSFTDNTAVGLHLMGLNEAEPSSMQPL